MLRIGLTALALLLSVPGRLYATDAIAAGIHLPVRMYCARNATDLGWLVRDDKAFYRAERAPARTYGHSLMQEAQVDLGRTQNNGPSTAKVSGWKQAGIYGLEFAGAAVGTSIAAVAGVAVVSGASLDPGSYYQFLGAATTYAVTSALLSSGAVHLVGKLTHQRRSFTHALAGGAVGGLVGAAALYWGVGSSPQVLWPTGLLLPPVCTVVAYNVW